MSKLFSLAVFFAVLTGCAHAPAPVPAQAPTICTPPPDRLEFDGAPANPVECRYYEGGAVLCVYGAHLKTKDCAALIAREDCHADWKLVKAECQKKDAEDVGERL